MSRSERDKAQSPVSEPLRRVEFGLSQIGPVRSRTDHRCSWSVSPSPKPGGLTDDKNRSSVPLKLAYQSLVGWVNSVSPAQGKLPATPGVRSLRWISPVTLCPRQRQIGFRPLRRSRKCRAADTTPIAIIGGPGPVLHSGKAKNSRHSRPGGTMPHTFRMTAARPVLWDGPQVRAGRPRPALSPQNRLPGSCEEPARGPAADGGVRPTTHAGVRWRGN